MPYLIHQLHSSSQQSSTNSLWRPHMCGRGLNYSWKAVVSTQKPWHRSWVSAFIESIIQFGIHSGKNQKFGVQVSHSLPVWPKLNSVLLNWKPEALPNASGYSRPSTQRLRKHLKSIMWWTFLRGLGVQTTWRQGSRCFSLGMTRPCQKQPHSHSRQALGCLYVTDPSWPQPVENCHQQLPSCLMLMQSARSLYTWRQFSLGGDWLKFKRSHAIVILKRNFMIHHFWCNLICLIKLYFTHSSVLMGQSK